MILTVLLLGLSVAGAPAALEQQPRPSQTNPEPRAPRPDASRAASTLVADYCVTCHNDRGKAGGLTLANFDAGHPDRNAETAEKMIRKLRAGMMPPPGMKRPDAAAIAAFVDSLESRLDEIAAANPNPGWRPFQRLNRAEYEHAVRDLLAVEIDTSAFLPPDTISHGFDNVADAQAFSATLMEGYLRAAGQISRLAVGDRNAAPGSAAYPVPENASQMQHVEGTPYGTRGGLAVVHTFPADGDYTFTVELHRTSTGELFGNTALAVSKRNEPVEISVDGARVGLLEVNPKMSEADKNGLTLRTPPVHLTAGPHRVAAAFIQRFAGPVDDLMSPIDRTLADSRIGTGFGITALPHLQELTIAGPFSVSGVSDTVSRRRIFTCRPTSAAEERPCAEAIVKRLAGEAYRGRVSAPELELLMRLYEQGRTAADFENGIRLAVQGLLANPRFVFRAEQAPPALRAGQTYRVADLDLASRLSFFLWGTVPDGELTRAARRGALATPAGLETQVRRMLADPRSEALSTRFAAQWLRLQDVAKMRPDALLFPYWDVSLSQAFQRETELFFDSLVREDRNILDLVTADYSFVNERLARHYGIPNVTGSEFRRVALPDNRRGILGQGSILVQTSVADRTSPVQRGKWVMTVLLGTPPPPPPPNVPAFETTKAAVGARVLSVRERMEEHRANPQCNSCHRVIDPLGLALENYDVTGRWRIKDNGVGIDATGELYDGTKMNGPEGLRQALLKHQDMVLLSFTENLMTYALGRRVSYTDMPAVRAIIRDASRHQNHMSSFILGVVKSAAFQMSTAPSETTESGR